MFKSLINYIKDKDYLIGIYNDEIYIYNYKNIIDINNEYIKINLGNKKVKIQGENICVKKLENSEVLIKIDIKGLNFYE